MRKELTPPDSTDDRYDLSYLCSIKQYCAPTGFLNRLALLGVPHMEKGILFSYLLRRLISPILLNAYHRGKHIHTLYT